MSGSISTCTHITYLFDRPLAKHRWQNALNELKNGSDLSCKVVGANWHMDGRVSSGREQSLLDHPRFSEIPNGAKWIAQIQDYFGDALCRPTFPLAGGVRSSYLETENATNKIDRTVPGHEQLVHVESLNNMLWRLGSAEYNVLYDPLFHKEFQEITGETFPSRPVGGMAPSGSIYKTVIDDLVSSLQAKGPDAIKRLAGLLCNSLGPNRPPWWGCFYQEVRPLLKAENWLGLCRSLGLGHLWAGQWLLVWIYEIDESRPHYRPTVIEANNNQFHYPSPPGKKCGITMPLEETTKTSFREVLHPPLSGVAAEERCLGILGELASQPILDNNQIDKLRSRHRERLAKECSSEDDRNWLARHAELV